MLGYVTVKREELKVKDFDRYRGFYCGVCMDLKESCGEISRLTLTYDMTFLAILLSSLYEPKISSELRHCLVHPLSKKLVLRSVYTGYAADMSVLLVYQKLIDDWDDEKSRKSLAAAGAIKKAYKKAVKKYPRQTKALAVYLKKLHEVEREGSDDLDLAAGLSGEFLREIFIYDKNDIWSRDLGEMGFYLGKFIYLMDAYEDVRKDIGSGNYNPFKKYFRERDDFDAFAKDILTMMAANAAAAFERLPIVENADILRNVIYAGIWNKYAALQSGKKEKNK